MRIVLNTFGSLGDVNPYVALALELKQRGHDPLVATAEVYRSKIEALDIAFAPVRPNIADLLSRPDLIEKLWHPRKGPDFLIREYLMPVVGQSFQDLLAACSGADLLLGHTAGYAGPVVAELLKLRWLSVALQPQVLFSVFDPPLFGGIPALNRLFRMSSAAGRLLIPVVKRLAAGWAKPIHTLRKRVGLPASKKNPIFEGQFSPYGTLALFSPHFSSPQPDWPPHTHATGFAFYDQLGVIPKGMPSFETNTAELERFLKAGPAPVLFTLGSSAVLQPGPFYQESAEAARRFGFRAILLVGPTRPPGLSGALPADVLVTSYAPYSLLMPRCAAIVHQGGIGTTSQALRAGRPMVIVPWAYDQPDNAERTRKLGVSETLSRSRYSAERVGMAIERVLDHRQGYPERAAAIGRLISQENGIARACDLIEAQGVP